MIRSIPGKRLTCASILVTLVATASWVGAQPAEPGDVEPLAPEGPPPPDASQVQHLEDALRPQPGGLKSDEVARRAELSSPEVRAQQKAVEAAAAKVDQAFVAFIPQVTLTGRYARLSPIEEPSLEGLPPGLDISFPIVLNIWTLQGSLGVPISDYVLRLSQNHTAASKSKRAAELQEKATRLRVQVDARNAYYNWIRAQGGVVVAQQGLTTAQAHLKDVKVAFKVGSASKADVMTVESQVASTELLVESTRNLTRLSEEQLRTMMHDPPGTRYQIGEDITAQLTPYPSANLADLYREAQGQRLEVKALEETVRSIRETRKVVKAGYLPRLDAFANLYYQNPNPRVFPQEEKWSTSWDVGAQVTWTINDTFSARGQSAEIEAKAMEVEAQKSRLMDGIRLEVTQAYNKVREADFAWATTDRKLKASEEAYRVRRELFRAGRATSSELTDAETELVRSRLESLNARIEARTARATLHHALGRDVVRPNGRSRR